MTDPALSSSAPRAGMARTAWLALALLALAVFGLALGASVGSTGFDSVLRARHDAVAWQIVWDIRLPRTLGAWLAGALLGLAGAVAQGLFRNPLADPGLVGVSSGAALAAAVTIVLGSHWLPDLPRTLGSWTLVGMAFGGNWKQTLAAGAGLGIVLYFMFDKLLDVVLPTGILSFLLGGR